VGAGRRGRQAPPLQRELDVPVGGPSWRPLDLRDRVNRVDLQDDGHTQFERPPSPPGRSRLRAGAALLPAGEGRQDPRRGPLTRDTVPLTPPGPPTSNAADRCSWTPPLPIGARPTIRAGSSSRTEPVNRGPHGECALVDVDPPLSRRWWEPPIVRLASDPPRHGDAPGQQRDAARGGEPIPRAFLDDADPPLRSADPRRARSSRGRCPRAGRARGEPKSSLLGPSGTLTRGRCSCAS